MREEGLPPGRPRPSPWSRSPAPWWASPWCYSAVFGPWAFFGGSTGVIYRHFSITIIAAMHLSVVVA